MSTGKAITEILEAYYRLGGEWVRIAHIAKETGLSREQLTEAIEELLECPEFQAEPEPFGHRITAEDKAYAAHIGGEDRHLIMMMES